MQTSCAAMASRKYDLLVFGATGFTGKYVAEYVAKTVGKHASVRAWAVAGRNRGRLDEVAQSLERQGSRPDVVVADVRDPASVEAMARSCRLLLNCVGPYRFFGEPVVRACAENGTHYLDISGEPLFIESMALKYDEAAKESGALIVSACGGDSVPADLGTVFAERQFGDNALVNSVDSFMTLHPPPGRWLRGHYATYECAVHGFGTRKELGRVRRALQRPALPPVGPRQRRRGGVFYDPRVRAYAFPFPGSDASVVRASQVAKVVQATAEGALPRTVQYAAYSYAESWITVALVSAVGLVFSALAPFALGRRLLLKFPRLFSLGVFSHEGPAPEDLSGASFTYRLHALGYSRPAQRDAQLDAPQGQRPRVVVDKGAEPDREVVVRIRGPEFGYVATPIFLAEAAYCLLEDKGNAVPTGVCTPATALGETDYIERLGAAGIEFKVLSAGPPGA